MIDRMDGTKAAMLLTFMLDELREEDLVRPCRNCNYPVIKSFADRQGRLYCGKCEQYTEDMKLLRELDWYPRMEDQEDG